MGCSPVGRGLWLDLDGEMIRLADGTPQILELGECWACGGAGIIKVYISNRPTLGSCEFCGGKGRAADPNAAPPGPRHLHEWQETDQQGPMWGRWWRLCRCACRAIWYKPIERPSLTEQRQATSVPWRWPDPEARPGRETVAAARGVQTPERLNEEDYRP